jgi:signal transduction histidine kinase
MRGPRDDNGSPSMPPPDPPPGSPPGPRPEVPRDADAALVMLDRALDFLTACDGPGLPTATQAAVLVGLERAEDLLWLARFDSQPPPGDEPVDVATIAGTCADRFRAVAGARNVTITTDTGVPALISAPPEWIDRLAGS